jgi:hypothetical protein
MSKLAQVLKVGTVLLLLAATAWSAFVSAADLEFPIGKVKVKVKLSHNQKNLGKPKEYEPKINVGYFDDSARKNQESISASYWDGHYKRFQTQYEKDEDLQKAGKELGLSLQFSEFQASPKAKCGGNSFHLSVGKRLGLPRMVWDTNKVGELIRIFAVPKDPPEPGDILMFAKSSTTAEHFAVIGEIEDKTWPATDQAVVWTKNGYEDFWAATYKLPLKKNLYDNREDAMVKKFLGEKGGNVQSYQFPRDLKASWNYWTPSVDRFTGLWADKSSPDKLFLIRPSPGFRYKPADINLHPLTITNLDNGETISAAFSSDDQIMATEWPGYKQMSLAMIKQHMGKENFDYYASTTKFLVTKGKLDAAGEELALTTPTAAPPRTGTPRTLVLQRSKPAYVLKSLIVSEVKPGKQRSVISAPRSLSGNTGDVNYTWDLELLSGRVRSELSASVAYCFPQAFPATVKYEGDDRWIITGEPNMLLQVQKANFSRAVDKSVRKKMGPAIVRIMESSDSVTMMGHRPAEAEAGVPDWKGGTRQPDLKMLKLEQNFTSAGQTLEQNELLGTPPKITLGSNVMFASVPRGDLLFKANYELDLKGAGSRSTRRCSP